MIAIEGLIVRDAEVLLQQLSHFVDGRGLRVPHLPAKPDKIIVATVGACDAGIQWLKKLIVVSRKDFKVRMVEALTSLSMLEDCDGCALFRRCVG
ncbi:hypothetical protein SB778_31505 [Paraburkholderia sp. SIMBA_050]